MATNVHTEDTPKLDTLRWLLGEWVQAGEMTTVHESWTELHRSAFKGTGITTESSNGNVRSEESLLLVGLAGAIYYIAKVKHNKYPVPFELISYSPEHAIFENSAHDFPKKLEYRLTAKNTMVVIVSDGDARSFSIRFKKEKMPMKAEDRKRVDRGSEVSDPQ